MAAVAREDRSDSEGLDVFLAGCQAVVLVATALEAEPFLAALGRQREMTVPGVRLVTGELRPLDEGSRPGSERPVSEAGRRIALGVSGCDKVNAAHALTWLFAAMDPPPRLVIQAGIAGALPAPGPTAVGGTPAGAGTPGVPPAAGASPAARAGVGDVVVATQEAYSDTGSSSPAGWLSARELGLPIAVLGGEESGGLFPMDAALVEAAIAAMTAAAARRAVGLGVAPKAGTTPLRGPRVVAGPCVTSSQMTGMVAEGEALARRWGALAESMEGAAAAHVCALHRVPFLEVRGISNLVTDRDRVSWRVEEAAAASAWAARAALEALDALPFSGVEP